MSGDSSGCHVAVWSEKQPGTLVIKDPAGNVVLTTAVDTLHRIGERPETDLLLGTGWSAYPGSEWRDEDWIGEWEVKVYTDSGAARKR